MMMMMMISDIIPNLSRCLSLEGKVVETRPWFASIGFRL